MVLWYSFRSSVGQFLGSGGMGSSGMDPAKGRVSVDSSGGVDIKAGS